MRTGPCLLIVTTWLLVAGCASGEDGQPVSMEILRDASGAMHFEEARCRAYMPSNASINLGYDEAVYWLKLTLRSVKSGDHVLVVSRGLDSADAYIVHGGSIDRRYSGSRLRAQARDVPAPPTAFHVNVLANELLVVYVRVSSENTIYLAPRLYTSEEFAAKARLIGLIEGLFYGTALALVLFNLLLFIGLRDPLQLWYVAFQLAVIATYAMLDEMPARFDLPGAERWLRHGEIVCVSIAMIAGVGFTRTLLDTRRTMARSDRVLVGVAFVGGILGLAGCFTAGRSIQLVGNVIVMAWSFAVFLVAVVAVRRRARNAVFFLFAWLLMLVGIVLATLGALGAVSTGIPGSYGLDAAVPKLGSVVEAMVLAVGLVVRVDRLRRERALANEAVLTERAARAEILERLVGGVSHEIGNPLNFVIGGVSALASEIPASNARGMRALGVVRQGAERMRRIVDNLRQYARARDVTLGETHVDEEVASTLALCADRVACQKIDVVRVIESVPHVQARPGELGQVLANLVSNACDAMSDGGTLRVACTSNGSTIDIVVADSGPGVPEDKRGAIFDPFFTTRAVGTGLGLAISSEIARRHGWELRLLEDGDPRSGGLRGAAFLLRMRTPLA